MTEPKFIAYYRVSTDKQGSTGYGLDAQKKKVADYVTSSNGILQNEFTEIKSGKIDERPELIKALKTAKLKKATLVISKLDRLSRDVAYISTLMKNTPFVVAEMPSMNQFTMHIFSALAQEERNLISQRTKDGLREAKARGVKLGNPNFVKGCSHPFKVNSDVARAAKTLKADNFASQVMEQIEIIKLDATEKGVQTTLAYIAKQLNSEGIATRRGCQWSRNSVKRIIDRVKE